MVGGVLGVLAMFLGVTYAQDAAKKAEPPKNATVKAPVVAPEDFKTVMTRMQAAMPAIQQRHLDLLKERYDLGDHPASGVTMARKKPVQQRVRSRLAEGLTWEKLAAMDPADIRKQDLFPAGFLPLPHPNHPEGGMLFPKFHIDEIKKQESRDLTRFDLDFDLPDHFLPEFPPPMFLTTRPDLGDVSQGNRTRMVDERPGSQWKHSFEYAHDGLHRLTEATRGRWASATLNNVAGSQQWTLDLLGNWEQWKTDFSFNGSYADYETQDRTHNLVNELTVSQVPTSPAKDEDFI
jgi:hypothetical protein